MAKITSEWSIPVVVLTDALKAELKHFGFKWSLWKGYIVLDKYVVKTVGYRVLGQKRSRELDFLLSDEYNAAIDLLRHDDRIKMELDYLMKRYKWSLDQAKRYLETGKSYPGTELESHP